MSKTCAEAAAEFVSKINRPDSSLAMMSWVGLFQSCSDFPQPKKKKQVWQWRIKSKGAAAWYLCHNLMTEEESGIYLNFKDDYHRIEKHSGPFEVEDI